MPNKNTPRDVFLHLLGTVTLYWTAASFITLMFQYVNFLFPDTLQGYLYQRGFSFAVRFAVASLVVVFPVYLLVSWYLNKIYSQFTDLRNSKLRKWLIYFTLFVAALIMIGDLTRILYVFLGGEITLRFILKALALLFTTAIIFGYYLDDVRRDRPHPKVRYMAIGVSVLLLFSLIGVFLIIGSPHKERLYRFDEQKVGDLQNLQFQIIDYWQSKHELPSSLNDLTNAFIGYVVPVDSQTTLEYEYRVTGDLNFELCAVFNLEGSYPSERSYPSVRYPSSKEVTPWLHGPGSTCFPTSIDPEIYLPRKLLP